MWPALSHSHNTQNKNIARLSKQDSETSKMISRSTHHPVQKYLSEYENIAPGKQRIPGQWQENKMSSAVVFFSLQHSLRSTLYPLCETSGLALMETWEIIPWNSGTLWDGVGHDSGPDILFLYDPTTGPLTAVNLRRTKSSKGATYLKVKSQSVLYMSKNLCNRG